MFWSEFLLLAGAHLLALASPGPDFLLLARSSLRHGRTYGLAVSLGIALANGLYIALVIGGWSVLQDSPTLLAALQWLASGYLAWLGWMFIRASRAPTDWLDMVAIAHAQRVSPLLGMGAGFLSALLNPKNGLFYFGLFSVIVEAHTGLGRRLFYGVWLGCAVLAWDAALVCLIAREKVVIALGRAMPLIERCAGLLLLVAAVALAAGRLR